MSDLISRQAAIDALTRKMVSIPTAGEKDLMGDVNRIRAEDISVIRRLPSAQPEPLDEWCTDCKEYDKDKHCCPRWNRVIRTTLKDMKEEQPESEPIDPNERDIEILSALRSKYCCFDEKEERVYHALSESIKAINSLEQSGKENR